MELRTKEKKKPSLPPLGKAELVYRLKDKYSYETLSKLFGVSRQYLHELYWRYWNKRIKDQDLKTCDVCLEEKETVKWRQNVKLCKECYQMITFYKRHKGQHGGV